MLRSLPSVRHNNRSWYAAYPHTGVRVRVGTRARAGHGKHLRTPQHTGGGGQRVLTANCAGSTPRARSHGDVGSKCSFPLDPDTLCSQQKEKRKTFQVTFLPVYLRFHVWPLAHKQVAPMCRNPPSWAGGWKLLVPRTAACCCIRDKGTSVATE